MPWAYYSVCSQDLHTVQVTQLRASRDKLLAELEKQFLEVDRLSVENTALSQVASPDLDPPHAFPLHFEPLED